MPWLLTPTFLLMSLLFFDIAIIAMPFHDIFAITILRRLQAFHYYAISTLSSLSVSSFDALPFQRHAFFFAARHYYAFAMLTLIYGGEAMFVMKRAERCQRC